MEHASLEELSGRIKASTASNVLLWTIIVFVVLFFLWAGLTKIDRTVRATGRVMPSAQLQIVSNLEGGIVQDILVRAGQTVARGDELIRLDSTQSGAELGSGEATTGALGAKIARLTAEVTGREPVYPARPDPAGQVAIERALHASRMNELARMTEAANARVRQAERAVAEASANYQGRVALRDSKMAQLRTIRSLVERGIEPRLSLVQVEGEAAGARSDAASAAEGIGRARAQVAEARAQMAVSRQEWRARAADELATAQAELSARSQALPALSKRVERTVVRSPMAGRVNRVLVATRGGSVQPGQPLVEIVPDDKSLLVEVHVRPQDIAAVRMGQSATVAITAYDRSIYGTIEGAVTQISPDSVTQEKTGESYYIVQVRTSSNGLRMADGTIRPITSGMGAEVDLRGEKRTVLAYILTPITRLGETAFREH
ncbi:HlyD family type I secretion periplasmic adaptor subunit [Sphingomonas sp.]|jgi:adhesin transport system membrane fusion protein|uniref:HlyD family type I secretion periplasmic adaptor subunit n=1 Tax=Sphingomonas sp. TaxID=28214 RepID=UPI002ED944D3